MADFQPVTAFFKLLESDAQLMNEIGGGLASPRFLIIRAGRKSASHELFADVHADAISRERPDELQYRDRKINQTIADLIPLAFGGRWGLVIHDII
jgi:hypothetical protein